MSMSWSIKVVVCFASHNYNTFIYVLVTICSPILDGDVCFNNLIIHNVKIFNYYDNVLRLVYIRFALFVLIWLLLSDYMLGVWWSSYRLDFEITTIMFYSLYLYIAHIYYSCWPATMAHSYRLEIVTWRRKVGPDICHRGCAYTVLQTVQRHGVRSAADGTVHCKEPLKSFEIKVGHSPGFGLPSVAILPWLCRKRRKAIFTHSLLLLFVL